MEKLMDVTEEQKKFAIDAMVALVIEEQANALKIGPTTILKDFVASKAGALLYDESSKLCRAWIPIKECLMKGGHLQNREGHGTPTEQSCPFLLPDQQKFVRHSIITR